MLPLRSSRLNGAQPSPTFLIRTLSSPRMPTYEFVCPDGHTFDKYFRTISSAPAEFACPVCGKLAARQISGGAGLLFKGSGFYITDYGKDGKKNSRPASPNAESSGSGSSGESKNESKSEKSESKSAESSSSSKSSDSSSISSSSSSTSSGPSKPK